MMPPAELSKGGRVDGPALPRSIQTGADYGAEQALNLLLGELRATGELGVIARLAASRYLP
jgi:hypothetical protein